MQWVLNSAPELMSPLYKQGLYLIAADNGILRPPYMVSVFGMQIPQRASQGGQGPQWQGSGGGGGQDWNQSQVYQPAVPPPQPSVVPPPNLFVPTRASATAAPPQQQVQSDTNAPQLLSLSSPMNIGKAVIT